MDTDFRKIRDLYDIGENSFGISESEVIECKKGFQFKSGRGKKSGWTYFWVGDRQTYEHLRADFSSIMRELAKDDFEKYATKLFKELAENQRSLFSRLNTEYRCG